MTETTSPVTLGTDWTRILADPDLVRQVGKLLQAYREAPPERREEALLAAMREIKAGSSQAGSSQAGSSQAGTSQAGTTQARSSTDQSPAEATNYTLETIRQPLPTPSPAAPPGPPFQPDVFSSNSGDDRRRHPRIRCFVAVELRVNDAPVPVWGNLSNTSAGGCLVETATPLPNGSKVEIGLWLANGTVWVKGFTLSGVVTRSAPTTGVRVRFDNLLPAEKDSLRQFLKYVQDTTRTLRSENSYMELLK